ncbi:hypothetical protein ACFQO4_11255 [Saliphagus sp. GCM10025334]
MNRRTLAVGIAVGVLLVVGTLTALALHPVSPTDHETPFAPADPEAYEASGTILLDGETYVDYEGAVAADGTAYFRARSDDGYVRELYEEDGVVYARLEAADETRIDEFEQVVGGEVVSQEKADGLTVAIIRAEDPNRAVETFLTEWNGVVADTSQFPAYERVDDGDGGVYEPRGGWIDSSRDYRITGASGELVVDSEAGGVTRIDIAFERTFAGSSLAYLRNREDAVEYEIEYELRSGDTAVEPPEWVERARADESE